MIYFWISLVVVLTFIEAITVNLTTIWFVASGLVALLISFVTDNVFIQFGVFSILGVAFLILTKPILEKWMKKADEKTNLDRILDMKGLVTETITPSMTGEVKVDGKLWTAIAKENLKKGDFVRILKIDGVKLIVEKWED